MRHLSSAALAKIATKLGTEPISVVGVKWNRKTEVYYSEKDIPGIAGKILELGNIDDVRNISGTGGNAQISITLDDTDGTIKDIYNRNDLQQIPVNIYQYFSGLDVITDSFLIFAGAIATPVIWSEGDRKISFDAITLIEYMLGEVGFSPLEAQFKNVSPRLRDKVWPLCFGDVMHVPAVQSVEKLRGVTLTGVGIPDYTLPFKYWHLIDRLATLNNGFYYYLQGINAMRALISVNPLKVNTNVLYRENTGIVNPVVAPAISALTLAITGSAASASAVGSIPFNTAQGDIWNALNFLDKLVIPQLVPGNVTPNTLGIADTIKILTQMEQNYVTLIALQQQQKQDHEDLTTFDIYFNKLIDKMRDKLAGVLNLNTLLDDLNSLIGSIRQQINNYTQPIPTLISKQISIPNPQTQLFTIPDPQINFSPGTKNLVKILQNTIKDIQGVINKINNFVGPPVTSDINGFITTLIQSMQTNLTRTQGLTTNATKNLEILKGNIEILEIQMENAEYAYKTIQEINKKIDKLLLDYHKTLHELYKVQRAINDQSLINSSFVGVNSNNQFPQNTEFRLDINGIIFVGHLNGAVFTINAVESKYYNIPIGPRQTNEIDAFWVKNPNFILKGCYCLKSFAIGPDDPDYDFSDPSPVQFRSRIFKVKEQIGTKCVIELMENKERRAPRVQTNHLVPLQDLPIEFYELFRGGQVFSTNTKQISNPTQPLLVVFNPALQPIDPTIFREPLPVGWYRVQYAFVDANGGTTLPSPPSALFWVDGPNGPNTTPTILLPALPANAVGMNVYITVRNSNNYTQTGPTTSARSVTVFNTPDPGALPPTKNTTGTDPYGTSRSYTFHAHTRQEIVRILENGIEKYEKTKLEQMKSQIEHLVTVMGNSTLDDTGAAIRETITKDVNEYMARVNKLRFKREAYQKASEPITTHEQHQLLKMENLKLNVQNTGIDNTPSTITPATRLYYITGYDITDSIQYASPVMLPAWFQFSPQGQELIDNQTIIPIGDRIAIRANYLPDSGYWFAPAGTECDMVDQNAEKYIANILPSTIIGVYGYQAINGVPTLVPLPKEYYTFNEHDTSYPPLAVTSVTLAQNLKKYNLGWDGRVYVSLISPVGPNTADIIEWIVLTWTNLAIDTASFALVHSQVANYPQNFALFQKKDALKLIEEIAFEARCAVYIKNEVVFIQYLGAIPSTTDTITESDIEDGSLFVEYTRTENIQTKLYITWKTDYAEQGDNTTILAYNIPKFGVRQRSYSFQTFNNIFNVIKTGTFWMIRYANTWKRVKFRTFLNHLTIEVFDWITLNFSEPFVANGPIPALVEKADYDSASHTITIECWCPVRAGEMSVYPFAFPAGLLAETVFPPLPDITAGLAGNYQNSFVPFDAPYKIVPNINLVDQLDLRPKDFGSVFPSDASDGYLG